PSATFSPRNGAFLWRLSGSAKRRSLLSDHPGGVDGRVDGDHLDPAAAFAALGLDDLEGGTVRQEAAQRRRVEAVAAAVGAEAADEARAGKREVAHRVEHLV